MKIELHKIKIEDIVSGYVNNDEEGVVAYNGLLNVRPKYQREFVYADDKRNAVIDTITKNFPLNVMYWVKNEDGTFEILDGQQRTLSFCMYVNNDFSFNNKYFNNLTTTEKQQVLDYEILIYFCEGNDKEKLDWFKIINIAGEHLTDQELRNATYTGPWLTNAKSIFSKTNCPAYLLSKNYVNGKAIRQELLETALKWISKNNIEDYMSIHQHDQNANELWTYFQNVINWINLTFPNYRKEMKGLNWGYFYDNFKNTLFDTEQLEKQITLLMQDDEVQNKKGIYDYVLTGNENVLNIRTFTENIKRSVYEKQNGICVKCQKHFEIDEMEADHITPWSKGGKTTIENCQMLCKHCNRIKSDI